MYGDARFLRQLEIELGAGVRLKSGDEALGWHTSFIFD